MLNVLYILEALRHNNIMPGLQPGWTRKDIEQLPNFLSWKCSGIIIYQDICDWVCGAQDGINVNIDIYPTWKQIFPPADRVTGYAGECQRCLVFTKV